MALSSSLFDPAQGRCNDMDNKKKKSKKAKKNKNKKGIRLLSTIFVFDKLAHPRDSQDDWVSRLCMLRRFWKR
jgi:hypothetical protein